MVKSTHPNPAPPVHPDLLELLRKTFPFEFPLNATDREVGHAMGTREVLEYLERLEQGQMGGSILRQPIQR